MRYRSIAMGLMPPYDPFGDPGLRWVVARVDSVEPARPTWSRPGTVTLVIEEVLRGELAPGQRLAVPFGLPREAQDAYFHLTRGLGPAPHGPDVEARLAAQRAELGLREIEVPAVGARIVTWLGPSPSGEGWDVPTLRTLGAATRVPMRTRWIDVESLERVRSLLRGR